MTDSSAGAGIVVELVAAEWNIPSRAAMALVPEIQRELGSCIAVRVVDPRDPCARDMGRDPEPDCDATNHPGPDSPGLPLCHPSEFTGTADGASPGQDDVRAWSPSEQDSSIHATDPNRGSVLRIPAWRVTRAGSLITELAGARPKREVLGFVRDAI